VYFTYLKIDHIFDIFCIFAVGEANTSTSTCHPLQRPRLTTMQVQRGHSQEQTMIWCPFPSKADHNAGAEGSFTAADYDMMLHFIISHLHCVDGTLSPFDDC
jgi:hypothetical protein